MTDLKIYEYSGRGSFSDWFGWDNGLSLDLGDEVAIENALEDQRRGWEYSETFNYCTLPTTLRVGVYCSFFNEHGGSRETNGFVVAHDEAEACALLDAEEQKYPVIEYEQD